MPVARRSVLLVVASLLCLCASPVLAWPFGGQLRGNGKMTHEKREVGSFTAVAVANGIDLQISHCAPGSLELSGEENVLPELQTEVEHGKLRIGFDREYGSINIHRLEVSLCATGLDEVSASGGSRVKGELGPVPELALHASGGSELHLRGIDASLVEVGGSGRATLELEGKTARLDLKVSGGTQIDLSRLDTGSAQVHASGGSDGQLRVNGTLRGSLSGGSSLRMRGGGKAQVRTSGGSEVVVD